MNIEHWDLRGHSTDYTNDYSKGRLFEELIFVVFVILIHPKFIKWKNPFSNLSHYFGIRAFVLKIFKQIA